MARTTDQPSTATRRNTGTTQPDTNGLGSLDEQNQRQPAPATTTSAARGLSAVRDEQND